MGIARTVAVAGGLSVAAALGWFLLRGEDRREQRVPELLSREELLAMLDEVRQATEEEVHALVVFGRRQRRSLVTQRDDYICSVRCTHEKIVYCVNAAIGKVIQRRGIDSALFDASLRFLSDAQLENACTSLFKGRGAISLALSETKVRQIVARHSALYREVVSQSDQRPFEPETAAARVEDRLHAEFGVEFADVVRYCLAHEKELFGSAASEAEKSLSESHNAFLFRSLLRER